VKSTSSHKGKVRKLLLLQEFFNFIVLAYEI
jgi:hypothetical protein